MEIRLAPELEAKIKESAAQQGRQPAELVEELVERHFDEDARFIEAVRRGEAALDRGEFLTHEQVGERLQAR